MAHLEFVDLEYRVRNTRTGNVIAAFPNSFDAKRYVNFLSQEHSVKESYYEIETVNAADFDTNKVIS